MGPTQSVIKGIVVAPLAAVTRVLVKQCHKGVARLCAADHIAIVRSRGRGIGLAELVRHRPMMMRTLYERRKPLPNGECLVTVRLQYEGAAFFGSKGRMVKMNDVILTEFTLGGKGSDFICTTAIQDALPDAVFFYWENGKTPGHIIPQQEQL